MDSHSKSIDIAILFSDHIQTVVKEIKATFYTIGQVYQKADVELTTTVQLSPDAVTLENINYNNVTIR